MLVVHLNTDRLASRMAGVKPSAIRELLQLGADPSIISFGGGYPDATLFPVEQLDSIYREALLERGRNALQYTVSNGPELLRSQIAARMAKDGAACSPDEVLILHGGQQGLDLVGKLFLNAGDVVVTENPTFLGALIAFNPCEPSYAAIPMDRDGIDTEALEVTLRTTNGIKFIYTIADFHNPTGVAMSLERRKRLIELANEYDVIVVEDAPYRETRFDGEQLPTLKSLDAEGRVIYLGSFSKILAPGLRLGWAAASADIIERLGLLKLAADTQCSTLNMAAVSMYLERFDIERHIAGIQKLYRHKKEVMIDAIREHMPADVRHTDAQGGLFTWLTFSKDIDTEAFMRDNAIPNARVAYVPGATFFPTRIERNHARLSYSTQPDERIVAGIIALATEFKRALAA
jgi:2-aminoadipate transaminase